MNTATLVKICLVLRLAARQIVVKPRESALRARMAVWVVLVSGLARWTSLPRAHRISSVTLRSISVRDRADTPARLAQAIDSVLGIDLFVFRRSCWKRSMVLHRFLALNGIESRINFGLQKDSNGTVNGHAWLEHQGQPLLEDHAGAYVVTFTLPRPPATGILPLGGEPDHLDWHRP